MHLPSHLPQPKAVAVESVFPHGKLQEVLWVQNWAAVRGSWKTAMRRGHKTMKTLYTHFTYNYNNMEDTAQLIPLGMYIGGNTHTVTHTNSCTHTLNHPSIHICPNLQMHWLCIYRISGYFAMFNEWFGQICKFSLRDKFSLKRDKTVLNKIANF